MPIETYPEIISMVKSHLAATIAQDKNTGNYTMISMREALKKVGANDEQIKSTLEYCANHGFSYCLDYTIPATHFTRKESEYPSQAVCVWGADQLLSRLWALS